MSSPIEQLRENLRETISLLEIHEKQTGKAPGRRFNVEVLNKSCIVLTMACWEAFLEDTVTAALEFLLANCSSPSQQLPKELLKIVSKELKNDPHELKIFDLAGDGWKNVLQDHKTKMINKFVGSFNTPRHSNIDSLFEFVIGLKSVSTIWLWKGLSNNQAVQKLDDYVTLRGSIAHRVQTSEAVTKKTANAFAIFVIRLAILTSNKTRNHIHVITGKYPWDSEKLGSVQ